MKRGIAFLFAATLAVPAGARAQVAPLPQPCAPTTAAALLTPGTAIVLVNDLCYQFFARSDGKIGDIPLQTVDLGAAGSFSLSMEYDADPFVNFFFGSLNSGPAALSFDVLFSAPVIGGPYDMLQTSGSGSLTATSGTGEVRHNPLGLAGAYVGAYVDLVHYPAVDLPGTSPCPATVGSPGSCLLDAASTAVGPLSPALLSVRLSYVHERTSTGGSTAATFNGGAELTMSAVPEPMTSVMVLAGVLMVAGVHTVRRRRA